MSFSRKVVTTVILTVFALGFVSCRLILKPNKSHMGAWMDVKEDDKKTLEVLNFAIEEYNKGNIGDYIVKIRKVIKFRKEMVARRKYALTIEAVTTTCKDFKSPSENCPTKIKRCSFHITTVPWKNIKTVTSQFCHA
ncbi:cystatin-C-like [Xenopus laevis]|uniref:Cystatin-C-like n=1 Tax=Xenopus laevis TaxID=8355 RepID=A0A8J0VDS6_XENLA|nr:cystatin-C-like [Xenopus laevis]